MEQWVDGMKRLGEMQLAISALEPPSEREKKIREHMERERALGRKRKSEKNCTCLNKKKKKKKKTILLNDREKMSSTNMCKKQTAFPL